MKVTLFTIPTARIALALFALWLPLQAQAETRSEIVQKKAAENPKAKWHELMDTGPFISDTFLAFGQEGPVTVLKGIAIKVGDKEQASVVFDTELVRMVAGFDGQVTLAGTPWDGKHGGNSYLPEDPGAYYFATNRTPGWSVNGKWEDPRKDNNGPLRDEHAEYLGVYQHGAEVVLSYTVGGTPVLEMPSHDSGALIRSFEVGEVTKDLQILLSEPVEAASGLKEVAPNLVSETDGLEIKTLEDGKVVLPIPAGTKSARFQVIYADPMLDVSSFAVPELKPLTKGGPALFPETIALNGILGQGEGSYISDSIPLPKDNPWMSEIRFGAFDFFSDGNRAACSTWNGDVWIAEGIGGDLETITWRRFASGLYQTLGLKIVDDVIYTQGRDQLTRLHDLNNDGEADFYECFNNDVLITEGFHEFSFDLQTDKDGNFYFSKAMPVLAGGRGFAHDTPHNGAILKVSPDGKKLERVAWGIRAPGGIGVGPDGQLTTGENEGSYVPRCKITWSDPKGGSFHGVIPSEWDGKEFVSVLPGQPSDYEKPLCWLPYYVDNSSGSQFWVPEDSEWELHRGEMIHLSYGKSSVYRVLREVVNGQIQGGVYRLPIDLTTASMRGRFHPETGNLYIIGFRGWQTNGGTGFQRVRYQGETTPVPLELNAHENGLIVQFSNKLDPEVAEDPRRYSISKWKYIWGPMYGSGRFSIDNPDFDAENLALKEASKGSQNQIDSVPVRAAKLLGEGDKLFLYIPGMTPAMQMEVKMDLAAADGTSFRETIWNTIHNLRPGFEDHGLDLDNLPEIDTAPIGAPGLILSMAHGSTDDATVVDRLAITLGEKTPATPFIDPRRGKEMVFEGNLVVEARDDLAFRLDGIGWASLKINGEVVAEGDLPLTSEPVTLDAGPHAIFCSFRRQDKGEGRLQLLWSGTDVIWEPVRPSAFRHLSNAVLEAKDKIRDGRDLFAAIRCIECHTPNKKFAEDLAMPEVLETLPGFANAGHRLNQGWVESWVRKPQDFCPSVAPDEAADIAAYLASLKSEEIPVTRGELKAGEELAKKLHLTFWTDQLKESAKHTTGGLHNSSRILRCITRTPPSRKPASAPRKRRTSLPGSNPTNRPCPPLRKAISPMGKRST